MSINSASQSSGSSTTNSVYNSTSRLTGMLSSLDTDALVKSMTSTAQYKIDAVKKKQTRQEWYNESLQGVKDDVNEFLNTFASVTGTSSMLKASSYATYKAVTSSTANAVSVTAAGNAETGDIAIKINALAKNSTVKSSAKISKYGTEISSNNTATLESLQLATPLKFNSDGKISFAINGKTFSFAKDTTLQSMINTINNDKTANVTMTYSRLSDSFSVTADSGGADSTVTIENLQGNAFGTNSAFKINEGTYKNGTNAEAVINGSLVSRNTNDFTIDNISYSLKKVTSGTSEETVSLSLERDYSATVDAVKKFVEGYNKLYDKLKNLVDEKDYSSDYQPLTDAQKDEMTTEQIDAWEKKAKSGILRHNSDIGVLMSNLRNTFFSALGGTGRSASDIGIKTAGYFDENAGSIILDEDALTEALRSDAGEVVSMFTNGSSTSAASEQGLMYKIRNSITSFSSVVKDSMKTTETKINSYDKEIDELETKLEDLADRYYKKFANMESALSKLNSQASFIGQMFSSG